MTRQEIIEKMAEALFDASNKRQTGREDEGLYYAMARSSPQIAMIWENNAQAAFVIIEPVLREVSEGLKSESTYDKAITTLRTLLQTEGTK
jgi:hypothetical protein